MSSIKGNRFHPFLRSQTPTPATIQPLNASKLHSSPLLDYLGYRFHTEHLVMICVACECAIQPGNAIGHVKNKHHIPVSKEQQDQWNLAVAALNVTANTNIPPPNDRQPVELLKTHTKALCCNACNYASLTPATFSKHWSNNHRNMDVQQNERFHEGCVQTFYSHAPCIYFEVKPHDPNSTPIYDVYMKEVPCYPVFDVTIPSASREIPPLLYCTRWHEHLDEYLTDKPARRLLFSLAHPSEISKDRLWVLVQKYLHLIVDIAKNSTMRVRCLLTEYPR